MRAKNSIQSSLLALVIMVLSYSNVWAADPKNGAKLYAKQCVRCHGTNGTPVFPGVPDFKRSNALMKADADLKGKIMTGSGMMPAFQGLLEEEEILDVIAYMRSLLMK